MGSEHYLVRGGELINGTGQSARRADLRISDGLITEIGTTLETFEYEEIIDATDRLVMPGFIDVHSHDDAALFRPNALMPKITQGVTTTVVGNCGHGCAPSVAGRALEEYSTPVLGPFPDKLFSTFAQYLETLEEMHLQTHAVALVPHAPLRASVMGMVRRPADPQELKTIAGALDEALEAGAAGLSLGLMYSPGNAADFDELTKLAGVVAAHEKLLVAHVRNEGNQLESSLEEFLCIGRATGCSLHVSHLKVTGGSNIGLMPRIIDRLEEARAEGIDITADVYPYTAGSTTASTLFPSWATDRGAESLLETLARPESRRRALEEMQSPWQGPLDNQFIASGPEAILLAGFQRAENSALEGRSLTDIAAHKGAEVGECFAELMEQEDAKLTIVVFQSDPEGLKHALSWPHTYVGSDGLPREEGYVHPRLFGTFPRVLSRYAGEGQLLSTEEAVRRMTLAPCARFGVRAGILAPRQPADIQIIDPRTYADRADYDAPRQTTSGLDQVMLSGAVAWPKKQTNGWGHLRRISRAGRTLERPEPADAPPSEADSS